MSTHEAIEDLNPNEKDAGDVVGGAGGTTDGSKIPSYPGQPNPGPRAHS